MKFPDPILTSLPTAAVFAIAGLLILAAGIVFLRRSDGPFGPLPGGPLRAGELVTELPAAWQEIGRVPFAEIETVSTGQSRTTGLIEYEGVLFIPCDLGFIWRRVSPPAKWVMALVWWVKRWHEEVLLDGRVVVRIRDKRYPFKATRVKDPGLVASLESEINRKAEKLMGDRLGPREEPEGEIWFFRLDPR